MLKTDLRVASSTSTANSPYAVAEIAKDSRERKRARSAGAEPSHDVSAPASAALAERKAQLCLDPETLRRHAWEIGERRAHIAYACDCSYVNLLVVSPGEAFVAWRVQQSWIDDMARRKGERWSGARFVLRMYDVSLIIFNGLNAHRIRDVNIDALHGERFVSFPLAGTTQVVEVGFVLRDGEFVAASRSPSTVFPGTSTSHVHESAALYVDDRLAPEPVTTPWDGAAYIRGRSRPRLREGLRIAMLSFEAEAMGHQSRIGKLVTGLAAALRRQGQLVECFVPAQAASQADFEADGVWYHALALGHTDGPVSAALAFARALQERLVMLPAFDLFHMQEWMTALVPWLGTRPVALAMSSIEHTRRNGAQASEVSRDIERLERETARSAECLLLPEWLVGGAVSHFGLDRECIHSFPMEGRPVDEWEAPLDYGLIKTQIGFHPFDRMFAFVGALEHDAGPDLLVEALPTVLSRAPNARILFIGSGSMQDHLEARARHLGVGHAVRLLGHVDLPRLIPLLRSAEALVMPARRRMPQDEAVVELARRAGRAVLTTHSGPSHTVRHEDNGLLVYDNNPSVVWGLTRLLDDAPHTERMGRCGLQHGERASWSGLARVYADLCAQTFSELTDAVGPHR